MNWIIRLGQWWERRRVVRWPESTVVLSDISKRLDVAEAERQIPPQVVRDMAILKQQMDRLELYVGLKREPSATHVAGTAKIS